MEIRELKFSVSNVELIEDIKQNRFQKAKIYAFADGSNAHTLDIDTEVLTQCADTIYDVPIVYKYNKFLNDFEGHEPDEVPCGFVKEENSNPVVFSKMPDGRTFITIIGTIWKKYSENVLKVFNSDGNKKSVSVEMAITDFDMINDKMKVKSFVLEGITILGDLINPAVKGANIQLEFSEDKRNYLMQFDDSIVIDNNKDSAVDGAWSNPRRKLFVPISKASNKVALLNEAYLVHGDTKDPVMTDFKYPHHVIRDGKLVVHISGVQSALARAKQQGILGGDVKEHLLKHYRELGLDTENFSDINIEESVGDDTMNTDEKDIDKKDMCDGADGTDGMMADDTKGDTKDNENQDMSDQTKLEDGKDPEDGKEPDEGKSTEMADDKTKDDDKSDDKTDGKTDDDKSDDKEAEMSKQIQEMSVEMSKLKDENNAYMAQIQEMSDYAELKQFKADTIEKQKQEEAMSKMGAVMSEIEKRGVIMSDTEKSELTAKIQEFSSIDAWSNYVKAQVFDRVENIDGTLRIGLPFETPKKTNSIWDN